MRCAALSVWSRAKPLPSSRQSIPRRTGAARTAAGRSGETTTGPEYTFVLGPAIAMLDVHLHRAPPKASPAHMHFIPSLHPSAPCPTCRILFYRSSTYRCCHVEFDDTLIKPDSRRTEWTSESECKRAVSVIIRDFSGEPCCLPEAVSASSCSAGFP